jgi:ElaB/YqjD/DUF883 family membrane-anchored ribosome-binding protein
MQNTGMQGSTHGGAGTTTRFAEALAEKAGTSLGELQQTARQTVDRVTEAATQAASDAAQRLSAHSDELLALQGRAMDNARTYVRAHPIAAIGIAIAIGLILSRLTSRR